MEPRVTAYLYRDESEKTKYSKILDLLGKIMGSLNTILQNLSVIIIPLLFAITLHEAAHGYVASKLGDKTALMLGRVTLNPAKHIDPLGTILIPIALVIMKSGFIFGWAKPVPVTWQNLRNPRRDMALVALAGPAANLLMALLWAAIMKISIIVLSSGNQNKIVFDIANFSLNAGSFGITINLILMVLNLLPLPPLDGSRVVAALLPPRTSASYDRIEPYGIWILLGLLFLGILQQIIMPPIVYCQQLIINIFNLHI